MPTEIGPLERVLSHGDDLLKQQYDAAKEDPNILITR